MTLISLTGELHMYFLNIIDVFFPSHPKRKVSRKYENWSNSEIIFNGAFQKDVFCFRVAAQKVKKSQRSKHLRGKY